MSLRDLNMPGVGSAIHVDSWCVDPVYAGGDGSLFVRNGHTTNPAVSDMAYQFVVDSATDKLSLVGQSGLPVPPVTAMTVTDQGVVDFPQGSAITGDVDISGVLTVTGASHLNGGWACNADGAYSLASQEDIQLANGTNGYGAMRLTTTAGGSTLFQAGTTVSGNPSGAAYNFGIAPLLSGTTDFSVTRSSGVVSANLGGSLTATSYVAAPLKVLSLVVGGAGTVIEASQNCINRITAAATGELSLPNDPDMPVGTFCYVQNDSGVAVTVIWTNSAHAPFTYPITNSDNFMHQFYWLDGAQGWCQSLY
jgi:hypothetical protein